MGSSKQSLIVVNVILWAVAALLHPVSNLLPTSTGETPKIYELLIPLAFVGLAYMSSWLVWKGTGTSGGSADV